MAKDAGQSKALSLLRLSDTEKRELETYLAREQVKRATAQNVRASPRFRYAPKARMLIELPSPGGAMQTYIVLPKDLSATGCAILHGAFTYPGTRCCITLHTRDHQAVLTPGIVVRCQHIVGRVHELGVRFETGIAVPTFVAVREEQAIGAAAAGMAPPETFLDTPGVRKLIAEIAAMSGFRDCPSVLRKKIQDLAKMADHLQVAKPVAGTIKPGAPGAKPGAPGAKPEAAKAGAPAAQPTRAAA